MLRCRRCALAWALFCLLAAAGGLVQAQTVSMVPHVSVPAASPFEVYVYLDADAVPLQGVEVRITFDPLIVSLDQVTAGDWFTTSGLPYYFYDYTTAGTAEIHFTGALLGASSDHNGVIGVCRFTALVAGVSPLTFTDWDVRGPENVDVGAGHSTGDRIVIEEAVGAEILTFSRLKALYR